jgi:hypothetical protein
MRFASKRLLALACLLSLCVAAPALAKNKIHAPPGNSGVEEYLEVVPGGGGNKPAKSKGSNGALSGKARRALGAYGKDGQAAANLAAATADTSSGGRSRSGRRGATPGTGRGAKGDRAAKRLAALAAADKGSGSGDGGVLSSLERAASTVLGGAGLGVGLPILLLAVLAGAVVLGMRRRSRSSES